MKRIFITVVYIWVIGCVGFAQKSASTSSVKIVKEKSSMTGQTNTWQIIGKDAVVVRDSGTHYIQVLVRNGSEILYGNRCAEMAAQKMGVEFIIIPKDIGFGMKVRNFFGINLEAHLRAFFKNGFFWRKKLKKRIKRCQEATGDGF